MNKTEIVKELIQKTGLNLKAFSQKADLPYSTLRSMLERGVENASVNNVIKVCSTLNISIESLYEMAENDKNTLSKKETTLLENFNKLNDLGKDKLIEYSYDLIETPKYINESDNVTTLITKTKEELPSLENMYTTLAAHDDNLKDDEKRNADIKIMEALNKRQK